MHAPARRAHAREARHVSSCSFSDSSKLRLAPCVNCRLFYPTTKVVIASIVHPIVRTVGLGYIRVVERVIPLYAILSSIDISDVMYVDPQHPLLLPFALLYLVPHALTLPCVLSYQHDSDTAAPQTFINPLLDGPVTSTLDFLPPIAGQEQPNVILAPRDPLKLTAIPHYPHTRPIFCVVEAKEHRPSHNEPSFQPYSSTARPIDYDDNDND